jgi:glucan 1,3-beta-glucosidase
LIGNPNSLPIIKATSNFNGFGLVDANVYQPGGALGYGPTNVFYRQIKNLVFDMTSIPASTDTIAVHWPSSQATSLQNCVFIMSDAPGTKHTGLFIEGGSGGFMSDLVFYGGNRGVFFGNQQYTVRNLTFYNAQTAIFQNWNWGWLYQMITIKNCTTGLDMSNGGTKSVGSVIFLDSTITNTKVGILTAYNTATSPPTADSLVVQNLILNNVPVAIQGPNSAKVLAGTTGTTTIGGWGEGHTYTTSLNPNFVGNIVFSRPAVLKSGDKFYWRSKPSYSNLPVSSFVSVRSSGAKGDGTTDDTAAINKILASAAKSGLIVFFDAGTYKVTSTILIPAGSKIVGESYPVIMAAGTFFSSASNPKPVINVGNAGDKGIVEWSDMIISTQGALAGAVLIHWNLAAPATTPGGMWDVHTRIGGFKGSNLSLTNCPTTPTSSTINKSCIAAFMSMYIAPSASALYMENNWFWVADHDLDDASSTQITIYAGRGVYTSATAGTVWMFGTASEHHDLYQYQFYNTQNIVAGHLQTETAYWQPHPNAGVASVPITGSVWNDPEFVTSCKGVAGNCAMGWGVRIVNSQNILGYGVGLYSFFNNNAVTCSNAPGPGPGNGGQCQSRILSIEGTANSNINMTMLNTVGATSMYTKNGVSLASYKDNENVYPDTIMSMKSNS